MLERCLLTGAAGGLATSLRPHLDTIARSVVLSDIAPVAGLAPHESFVACDLGDAAAVDRLMHGIDGIIHLGGISTEQPFERILNGNIVGAYNLFDAARRHGRPRVIFASSNHVIGYHRREMRLDSNTPTRPDSLYGVSKVFGEAIASLYFDKFGLETLSVRIGWCFPDPVTSRSRATWLAVEDLVSLCSLAFATPRLGHTIVFGVSDNDASWWDNREVAFLGWKPRHSSSIAYPSDPSEPEMEDGNDPAVIFQGGRFVTQGHPDDDVA